MPRASRYRQQQSFQQRSMSDPAVTVTVKDCNDDGLNSVADIPEEKIRHCLELLNNLDSEYTYFVFKPTSDPESGLVEMDMDDSFPTCVIDPRHPAIRAAAVSAIRRPHITKLWFELNEAPDCMTDFLPVLTQCDHIQDLAFIEVVNDSNCTTLIECLSSLKCNLTSIQIEDKQTVIDSVLPALCRITTLTYLHVSATDCETDYPSKQDTDSGSSAGLDGLDPRESHNVSIRPLTALFASNLQLRGVHMSFVAGGSDEELGAMVSALAALPALRYLSVNVPDLLRPSTQQPFARLFSNINLKRLKVPSLSITMEDNSIRLDHNSRPITPFMNTLTVHALNRPDVRGLCIHHINDCEYLTHVFSTLSQCGHIERLVLVGREVGLEDGRALNEYLSSPTCALRHLAVRTFYVDFSRLYSGLSRTTSLLSLTLSSGLLVPCRIPWSLLTTLLSSNTRLEDLNLNLQPIGTSEEMSAALSALTSLSSLTSLSLSIPGLFPTANEALRLTLSNNLNTLSDLSLHSCDLIHFPIDIALRSDLKLEYLSFRGNDSIIFPPRSFCKREEILEYFADLRAGCEHPRTVSALVVGHGAAGKTTAINRALRNTPAVSKDVCCWSSSDVHEWIEQRGLPHSIRAQFALRKVDGKTMSKLLTACSTTTPQQTSNLPSTLATAEMEDDCALEAIRVCLSKELGKKAFDCIEAEGGNIDLRLLLAELKALRSLPHTDSEELYISTVGINSTSLPVPTDFLQSFNSKRNGSRPLTDLSVRVLDFAGQSQYYVSHQLFLAELYSVFLFVAPAVRTTSPSASETAVAHPLDPLPLIEWQHWLSSVSTALPSSTHIPSWLVLTHLDKINQDPNTINSHCSLYLRQMQSFLSGASTLQRLSATAPSNDDLSLSLRDCVPINYASPSNPETLSKLKHSLFTAAAEVAMAALVPSSYLKALEAVEAFILDRSRGSDRSLLPFVSVADLKTLIASAITPLLASECKLDAAAPQQSEDAADPLISRCVHYLHSMGVVYADSRLTHVVLEPLKWLPRVLSLFIGENRHLCCAVIPNERGVCRFPDIFAAKVEMNCHTEQEVQWVMDILCKFALCHSLQTEVTPSPTNRAYLFPFLLPESHPLEPDTDWFTSYPLRIPPSYLLMCGRRYTVTFRSQARVTDSITTTATAPFPPAFFPALQVRLLKFFGTAPCRLISNAISISFLEQISFASTTIDMFVQCQIVHDPVRKLLHTKARCGYCGPDLSVDLQPRCSALLTHTLHAVCLVIDNVLNRFPGLSVRCSALCPHCLPRSAIKATGFPLTPSLSRYSTWEGGTFTPVVWPRPIESSSDHHAHKQPYPSRWELSPVATARFCLADGLPSIPLSAEALLNGGEVAVPGLQSAAGSDASASSAATDRKPAAILRPLPPPTGWPDCARRHVFISYAGEDRVTGPCAAAYLLFLQSLGIPCFFDQQSIELGKSKDDQLSTHGIFSSAVMVCLVTPQYLDKKWPQLEALTAIRARLDLVPVFVNGVNTKGTGWLCEDGQTHIGDLIQKIAGIHPIDPSLPAIAVDTFRRLLLHRSVQPLLAKPPLAASFSDAQLKAYFEFCRRQVLAMQSRSQFTYSAMKDQIQYLQTHIVPNINPIHVTLAAFETLSDTLEFPKNRITRLMSLTEQIEYALPPLLGPPPSLSQPAASSPFRDFAEGVVRLKLLLLPFLGADSSMYQPPLLLHLSDLEGTLREALRLCCSASPSSTPLPPTRSAPAPTAASSLLLSFRALTDRLNRIINSLPSAAEPSSPTQRTSSQPPSSSSDHLSLQSSAIPPPSTYPLPEFSPSLSSAPSTLGTPAPPSLCYGHASSSSASAPHLSTHNPSPLFPTALPLPTHSSSSDHSTLQTITPPALLDRILSRIDQLDAIASTHANKGSNKALRVHPLSASASSSSPHPSPAPPSVFAEETKDHTARKRQKTLPAAASSNLAAADDDDDEDMLPITTFGSAAFPPSQPTTQSLLGSSGPNPLRLLTSPNTLSHPYHAFIARLLSLKPTVQQLRAAHSSPSVYVLSSASLESLRELDSILTSALSHFPAAEPSTASCPSDQPALFPSPPSSRTEPARALSLGNPLALPSFSLSGPTTDSHWDDLIIRLDVVIVGLGIS